MNGQRTLLCGVAFVVALVCALGPVVAGQRTPARAEPAVDARIQILWPHGPQGEFVNVRFAPLVNVEVYLFKRGTLRPVSADFPHRVTLRWAQNTYNPSHDPLFGNWGRLRCTHHLAPGYQLEGGRSVPDGVEGQRVIRTIDGRSFPAWVFNDVLCPGEWMAFAKPVHFSTYFIVEVDGVPCRTSVWAHSEHPLTFLPSPMTPAAVDDSNPDAVDARFDVVWPHDDGKEQPVAQADYVNIGVSLFKHTELDIFGEPRIPTSLGLGISRSIDLSRVRLLCSLNDGYLEPVATANQVLVATGRTASGDTISWPRWVFNNVEVSAARDPANKFYFAIEVEGIPTHTAIWAHGADARTYFPEKDKPDLSAQ